MQLEELFCRTERRNLSHCWPTSTLAIPEGVQQLKALNEE